MKKASNKKGAATPMGATPRPTVPLDPKQSLAKLKETAKLIPAKDRKAFVAQGAEFLKRQAVHNKMANESGAIFNEIRAVLDKHGVKTSLVILKRDVSVEAKKFGVRGWTSAISVHDGNNMELAGVLAGTLHKLNSQSVSHSF